MQHRKFLFIFLFNWLSFLHVFAQTPHQNSLDSLIEISVQLTVQQKYDSAMIAGKQIIARDKTHPIGYLFVAVTLQSKMMDFETTQWEKTFLTHLKQARQAAETVLDKEPRNAWALFYLGSAYSYQAFYSSKQNHYMAAFRDAARGISALRKAVDIDSTLYDAYLGLGSYLFWRSQKTKSLTWLPFIKDERKKGIELIELSIQKGAYSRYAGINALVWIYIELKDYENALKWAKIGEQAFPGSRYFAWCLAESCYRRKDYQNAVGYYQWLLDSLSAESFNNHYNEIVCLTKLADSYYSLNQFRKALMYCYVAERLILSPDIKKRASKKFSQLNEIKLKCEKQLQQAAITPASY